MKIIHTHKMNPADLKPQEREWCYNGLDCMITAEVLDALLPQLDIGTQRTYEFSKALQGPVLEMRLRGVKVDLARRAEVLDTYYDRLDILERQLERIVREGCGFYGFNWRSNQQKIKLFYEILGIPAIKKAGKPTVNRDALERMQFYTVAKQIVAHLLLMNDLGKRIGTLKTEIDPDGRIRTSYNIAGTETGRFSSSFSEFGTGTNMQNIEDLLRSIFVADDGMKMAYLDAKQGESRVVGAIEWNLFKDGKYLDSCEAGDLHTNVAKLCWPSLEWTGNQQIDHEIAERPYYRHYSRRFMCKKIGHGTNYGGKPRTLSHQAQVEIGVIEDFQPKYFLAFPAHLRWHAYVEQTLRSTGILISLTGRRRHFFGRRDSDETLREAIAFDPQGSLADIVNRGMLNVWHANSCQLLLQNHDAIIIQYPEAREDEIIPKIKAKLSYPVQLKHDRILEMPYDCKTGFNWGEYNEKTNPDGLKAYKPGDKRKRSEKVNILDRVVHRAYK